MAKRHLAARAHTVPAREQGGMVRIRVELLTVFRQKAGTGQVELEMPAGTLTALDALRRLEEQLAPRSVAALEGELLREGVLLFVRSPGAPTRRVAEPARELLREGETLVLALALDGG